MPAKRLFGIISIIFLFVTCISCKSSTDLSEEKRILVIQSYEKHFPAYEKMKEIMSSDLRKKGIHASVYSFYLDCEQYSEKQQRQKLFKKLNGLSTWNPDIILVNDDQALNALISSRHPLAKSIPVVFMGVSYPNIPIIRKYPNMTGFYDKPDYKRNIELIRRLVGNCIVIRVSDDTFQDNMMLADMNAQIQDICAVNNIYSLDRVRLSGKNGISISDIPKIKPDTMYISTLSTKSANALIKGFGENYYNKAYLATKRDYMTISLGRLSAFPCFSVINELIGNQNGVVGGYVTVFKDEVEGAVNRVVSILKGTPPSDFPQIEGSNKAYVFDYGVLERWGIDSSKLPEGAIIANMPFVVQYKYYIWAAGFILVVMLLLLFSYQRKRYIQEALHKKDAQEKLKREKTFLSFALDSGNIFAFRYSKGVFEFDNRFYHYLGMPCVPMKIEEFQDAIHPEELDNFLRDRNLLDSGFLSRKVTQRRCNFNKKGYEWWEFRYAQNKNEKDSVSGDEAVEVSGLCLNIQRIKDTENSLIAARRKAEESDRMKLVFLANMSHEIRTPLNAIVGFSQLLNSDMPLEPEEKAEFIDLITKNSDLLLKLINDILDLSRIESGSMSFSYENLDLSKLMGDIFHTHQLMMPEGVELKIRVPHEPLIIRSDHFRLTQVCINFINNAVKFTAKGYIEIGYELSADGKSILISVKDTGKGIPDDKKEKVFERFQKLDEFAQGTGLGLAICQSIVHTFHGSISLESEVGVGSKFTISLPYTPGLELEERT